MCCFHYLCSKYHLIWIKEEKNKKCSLICNCFSGIFLRAPQQNGRFLFKTCTLAAQPGTEVPPTTGVSTGTCVLHAKARTWGKAAVVSYIRCSLCSGKPAEHLLPKRLSLGAPDTAPRSKAARGARLPTCTANLTQLVKSPSPFTDAVLCSFRL